MKHRRPVGCAVRTRMPLAMTSGAHSAPYRELP